MTKPKYREIILITNLSAKSREEKQTDMAKLTKKQLAKRHEEKLRKKIVKLAQETVTTACELEIDDNAQVSIGDSGGCYVQSWIWLENPKRCKKCHAPLSFRGYCPSCRA